MPDYCAVQTEAAELWQVMRLARTRAYPKGVTAPT